LIRGFPNGETHLRYQGSGIRMFQESEIKVSDA
jgi:hypothetical protein